MTEPEQRPQAPLDTERVRAHARRVLDSDSFSKAHSLRRFLAYVVDETLAGRADSLKEYAIGVEVFGRGDGFDPRADTIVRVQARRLRSKLEQDHAVTGTRTASPSTCRPAATCRTSASTGGDAVSAGRGRTGLGVATAAGGARRGRRAAAGPAHDADRARGRSGRDPRRAARRRAAAC